MSLPEGTEWTETQVVMNSPSYSFPILRAAVRVETPSEESETTSLYPSGPPESFMLYEVALPGVSGAGRDELMDQIVTLIDDFVQPYLSPGSTTSTNKAYFQGPAQVVEGS